MLNPLLIPFVLRISSELRFDCHGGLSEISLRNGFRYKLFIIKKTGNSLTIINTVRKIQKPSHTQEGWMRRSLFFILEAKSPFCATVFSSCS